MHKFKIIGISIFVSVLVLALIWLVQPEPSEVMDIPEVEYSDDPVPNFAEISNVKEKKKAFFDYLKPAIASQNEYILKVRQNIQAWRAKYVAGEELTEKQQRELAFLLDEYRVDEDQPELVIFDKLLAKVDIIPAELVLIQSANESAWGTSRFARKGYNFFGLWCFVENCGFVPKRRNDGASHEVAKFDNLSSAMYSYMRNLNSHPAYKELRTIRQELRENQQKIAATRLVEGLSKYSERGEEYIEELKQMIRINRELIST
ncbi:glucosaminidase domain-containing protein [Glaciecola sp. 1036]|uniref:glucosaminidase domain-containing protein n=1 Tax=Alteromonadaceae TaxID=72275 RepID=UPI003CFD64C9